MTLSRQGGGPSTQYSALAGLITYWTFWRGTALINLHYQLFYRLRRQRLCWGLSQANYRLTFCVTLREYSNMEIGGEERLGPGCGLPMGGPSIVPIPGQTVDKADIHRGFRTVVPHFKATREE